MQRVAQSLTGKDRIGGIGQSVVDDEVDQSRFSVLTGTAVDMDILAAEIAAVVDSRPHESIPEQNGEVIGARKETLTLQKAIVGGGQGVVEDDAIRDGAEAARLIEGAQNIQVGGGPGITAAAARYSVVSGGGHQPHHVLPPLYGAQRGSSGICDGPGAGVCRPDGRRAEHAGCAGICAPDVRVPLCTCGYGADVHTKRHRDGFYGNLSDPVPGLLGGKNHPVPGEDHGWGCPAPDQHLFLLWDECPYPPVADGGYGQDSGGDRRPDHRRGQSDVVLR